MKLPWILAAAGCCAAGAAGLFPSEFWKVWGDGQAELASYDLVEPHYGKPRQGVAVAIWVSETFSNSARVKADPGKHPKTDEFGVMKLNLVKDFQTGIYDYNDMTSVFVATQAVNGRGPGYATKVSFSSQEWCGNVFHQILLDPAKVRSMRHSYFDGEGDANADLPYPANGVTEDSLPFWARGMAEPALASGETKSVDVLTSLQWVRDRHVPASWAKAELSRGKDLVAVSVPAGKFYAEVFTATLAHVKRTYYVEPSGARRIVKWETSAGEKGELLASERLKYWQLNGAGGEEALKKLKLAARPRRTT
jgi:hypothetical protein